MPDDDKSSKKWKKDTDSEFGGDVFIFVKKDKDGKIVEIARLGKTPRHCPIIYSIQTIVTAIKDGACDVNNYDELIDEASDIVNKFAATFECPGVCPIPKVVVGTVGTQDCEFDASENESFYTVVGVKKVECHSA